MTDFNDGEWHGWNGGDCPVHPDSVVQTQLADETRLDVIEETADCFFPAANLDWESKCARYSIIAFRVVTPYVEPVKPLERWVIYSRGVPWAHYNNRSDAELDAQRYPKSRIVHMREVLP